MTDTQFILTTMGLLLWLLGFAGVVLCFLKDKPWSAIIGIIGEVLAVVGWTGREWFRVLYFFNPFPLVPVFAALRIGRPDSRWAKWFYGPKKMERALRRFPREKATVSCRYRIGNRFLSYLSATWCGSMLLGLGAICTAALGQTLYKGLISIHDVYELCGYLFMSSIYAFFCLVFGIAFGRFLLRAIPPPILGQTGRRQFAIIIIIIATASCAAVIGIFAYFQAANAVGEVDRANQSAGYQGQMMATSNATGILKNTAAIAPFVIICIWVTGAVGPLVLRHRRPRAFLDRPFVLFLRRFSTFSDRSVLALILRKAKFGVPVVFLTPTLSKPQDWDPFIVGFAGLKVLRPLASVPIVLRARDDDWQRAADELIRRAKIILIDISEGSGAIRTEAEMIEKAGRWSDTVCLRHTSSAHQSSQDPIDTFSNARGIDYSKSWMRALPRLVISLPVVLWLAFMIGSMTTGLMFIPVALMFYSMVWRPAVSRKAKIELNRVLRNLLDV
jgi:hypothetical protein